MSIGFNSGGLITRGLGDDQRLLTRGMGRLFDAGGVESFFKRSEYTLRMLAPILKNSEQEVSIFSSVNKQLERSLGINIQTDHSKLIEILDVL